MGCPRFPAVPKDEPRGVETRIRSIRLMLCRAQWVSPDSRHEADLRRDSRSRFVVAAGLLLLFAHVCRQSVPLRPPVMKGGGTGFAPPPSPPRQDATPRAAPRASKSSAWLRPSFSEASAALITSLAPNAASQVTP